jgi:hypothetical protein
MGTRFEPDVTHSMWNQCNLVYVLTKDFYAFHFFTHSIAVSIFHLHSHPKAVSIFFLLKQWDFEF